MVAPSACVQRFESLAEDPLEVFQNRLHCCAAATSHNFI